MAQNAEGNPPETDTASHECAICRHDYDFLMPPALVEAAEQERLVVFAGAGISTESLAFPTSFYDDIKAQLPEPSTDESFPGVMSSCHAISQGTSDNRFGARGHHDQLGRIL
jgi:hypothetical protein